MAHVSIHVRGDPSAPIALTSGGKGGAGLSVSSGAVSMADTPPYRGDYEITPSASEKELPTEGLRMVRNLTVLGIPVSVASNDEGGVTVSIAS